MAEMTKGETLKLYNFPKRRNSTKLPIDATLENKGHLVAQVTVVYKDGCDILRPRVILAVAWHAVPGIGSGDNDAYWIQYCNYAKLKNRYYWIKELKSISRDHWEIALESDPLASFCNFIDQTEAFVEYCNDDNTELIDNRLPRKTEGNSKSLSAQLGFSDGTGYIVATSGANGIKYYRVTKSNYDKLLSSGNKWLDETLDAQIKKLPADPVSTPISADAKYGEALAATGADLIKAFKYLGQCLKWSMQTAYQWVRQGFSKDKMASNIIASMYFPMSLPNALFSSSETIYLGNFETGVSGEPLLTPNWRISVSLEVKISDFPQAGETHWGRRSEFCKWSLYVPFVGTVELPSDLVVPGSSKIEIDYNINVHSGACNVTIGIVNSGGFTATSTCNIQIGANYTSAISNGSTVGAATSVAGIIGGIGGVAAGIASGGASGLATASFGAVACSQNAMQFQSSVSSIGNVICGATGGVDMTGGTSEKLVTLTRYWFGVSETSSNMKEVLGTPQFKVKNLSTITGYVKCCGASVLGGTMTCDEKDIVNSFLNSGCYLEHEKKKVIYNE